MMRPAGLLLSLSILAGCAGTEGGAAPCPPGMQAAQRAELFLGRAIPAGGEVPDRDVEAFVADTITPAFPDGVTLLPARGQWRGADGRIAREPSLIVMLVLPGATAAEAQARIAPVAQAWVTRFRQESALRSVSAACVGF